MAAKLRLLGAGENLLGERLLDANGVGNSGFRHS
jgi:hypothetical protein